MIDKQRLDRLFENIYLTFFIVMALGIPLVFTPLTRSVFEVNKLLVLRSTTILLAFTWIVQSILYARNGIVEKNTIKVLGIPWRRTWLEIPLLMWLASNVISTIFSENIRISFFGSYDRWEGLITTFNYILLVVISAKLVRTKRMLITLLWSVVSACGLSTFYAIYQAHAGVQRVIESVFGYRGINWSIDPTMRVFASINNPVHFCAYMGMGAFIVAGLLFYYAQLKQDMGGTPKLFGKRMGLLFIILSACIYCMFLSYSRATWVGFLASSALLSVFVVKYYASQNYRQFLLDILIYCLAIATYYLMAIFSLHRISLSFFVGLSALFLVLALLQFFTFDFRRFKIRLTPRFSINSKTLLQATAFFILHAALISAPLLGLAIPLWALVGISAASIALYWYSDTSLYIPFSRLLILFLFGHIQTISISLPSFISVSTFLVGFYLLSVQKNRDVLPEIKEWLMGFILIICLILLLPNILTGVAKIVGRDDGGKPAFGLKVMENANIKIAAFQKEALGKSARKSMWRSSGPWIKDYVAIGSGLDTVKFMYPNYREPEYGILEGGHNYTPDRLHNEYLNTLATKGVLGFIAFYVLMVLGWVILMAKGLFKTPNKPEHYLMLGLTSSAFVYLAQVLFNFGVVATLYLFYISIGLALATLYIFTPVDGFRAIWKEFVGDKHD